MYAFYSTLAIGGTVMMSMFAAMLATRVEADRRPATISPSDDRHP